MIPIACIFFMPSNVAYFTLANIRSVSLGSSESASIKTPFIRDFTSYFTTLMVGCDDNRMMSPIAVEYWSIIPPGSPNSNTSNETLSEYI